MKLVKGGSDGPTDTDSKVIDLVSRKIDHHKYLTERNKQRHQVDAARITDLEIKLKQLIDLVIDLVRHTEELGEWKDRTNDRMVFVAKLLNKICERDENSPLSLD